jgi:SAM-dependent methyltransferase
MHEPRSVERLQAAYLVERSLRERLMAAPCADRGRLYTAIYEELFRSLADHPQHRRSPADKAQRIASQRAFLAPHLNPRTRYLEIGCGDATLTFALAGKVAAAYGLDVTPELVATAEAPGNFRFVQTAGTDIALPAGSIDLVYSNQLLEHLHPDDAVLQLREVHRVLRPGGCYLCRTPNRVSGPHDISCYFADTAQGLHLREYDAAALRRLFREAGFKAIRFFLVLRGHQIVLPYPLLALAERAMAAAPSPLRRRLARNGLIRRIFGIDMAATK